MYFRLIAEVGAARATVITYVNPAVAVALGVIVLASTLTASIVGSFVLILAGSILATRANRGPAPGPARGPETADEAAPGPRPCAADRGRTGRRRRV